MRVSRVSCYFNVITITLDRSYCVCSCCINFFCKLLKLRHIDCICILAACSYTSYLACNICILTNGECYRRTNPGIASTIALAIGICISSCSSSYRTIAESNTILNCRISIPANSYTICSITSNLATSYC